MQRLQNSELRPLGVSSQDFSRQVLKLKPTMEQRPCHMPIILIQLQALFVCNVAPGQILISSFQQLSNSPTGQAAQGRH